MHNKKYIVELTNYQIIEIFATAKKHIFDLYDSEVVLRIYEQMSFDF